jgi:dihydroorotase
MKTRLIKNAIIINEGKRFKGSVLIKGAFIDKVIKDGEKLPASDSETDAEGLLLIPGAIDDQVHFREPGLTHKGDITSESMAAVAGGVTSYMEMPNTNPQATTIVELEKKFERAANCSPANYSFYLGATNDNLSELLLADPLKICGIKVFMGSSTGNMLVDNPQTLKNLFSEVKLLIATHCEDESIIQANLEKYRKLYGDNMPFKYHPDIRNAEACYKSSALAVELASKYNSRLHILHLSTQRELALLNNKLPLSEKKITGEVCVHHLWFNANDYDKYGSKIKWNPAIKSKEDQAALIDGLKNNLLDVVATDHAPHTKEEKARKYFDAPSGGPLVQHSVVAMLEMAEQGIFTKEMVVEKMCHAPATLFKIKNRGFIREGYFADIVLIKPHHPWLVEDQNVLYKCGWSPLSGTTFSNLVTHTYVNGHLAYDNGNFDLTQKGFRLEFNV